MKRCLVVAVLVAAVAVTSAAIATAAASTPNWPAICTKVGCVDKHLNALYASNQAQNARFAKLKSEVAGLRAWKAHVQSCVQAVNLSWLSYYVYDSGSGNYRALNTLYYTQYGDNVNYQMLYDACTPAAF